MNRGVACEPQCLVNARASRLSPRATRTRMMERARAGPRQGMAVRCASCAARGPITRQPLKGSRCSAVVHVVCSPGYAIDAALASLAVPAGGGSPSVGGPAHGVKTLRSVLTIASHALRPTKARCCSTALSPRSGWPPWEGLPVVSHHHGVAINKSGRQGRPRPLPSRSPPAPPPPCVAGAATRVVSGQQTSEASGHCQEERRWVSLVVEDTLNQMLSGRGQARERA
jgi:hypothetical protein